MAENGVLGVTLHPDPNTPWDVQTAVSICLSAAQAHLECIIP